MRRKICYFFCGHICVMLLLVVGTKEWTVNRILMSVKTTHAWTKGVVLILMAATPASACEVLVARTASWWVLSLLRFPDSYQSKNPFLKNWNALISNLELFIYIYFLFYKSYPLHLSFSPSRHPLDHFLFPHMPLQGVPQIFPLWKESKTV